jgi:hypothetical protein
MAGAAIVPRSSQSAHLKENLDDVSKFELSVEEMTSMGWVPQVEREKTEL